MIPYGRQHIDDNDIEAVVKVLQSDWLTQGPAVPAFEKAVAHVCLAQHAVAVNSATSALHLACMALNVGVGDWVWTSPNSFVASANCALYCGAKVDFVDIELTSGNMSVAALEEKLRLAETENRLPKVVIPVHFAGQSCDMAAIAKLAHRYGFKIIEDASHAIGGRYAHYPVGSCRYSDICVFSFHPVKIITTGEGGMAMTNDPLLARRMQMLRSHGITNDTVEMTEPSHGPWYYQQQLLGFNYRMTDIAAALGHRQLAKLTAIVTERNALAARYDAMFAEDASITPLTVKEDVLSSYHLYVLRLSNADSEQHRYIVEKMRDSGIFAHLHYIPIYLQPYYQQLGFCQGYCPQAEQYYREAITLPLYPGLTEEQQHHIAETLKGLL